MKDNFSAQAAVYAQYRPGYPPALFDYLETLSGSRQAAWDCATGNGQIAIGLSAFFEKVYATDISEKQLAHAAAAGNIEYRVEPAEASSFADHTFDLIVVAQAIHWFRFDHFYREVKRTLKQGGVLVVTGYDLLRISPAIDAVLEDFHERVVGPYWDPERIYVDERYKTIPFPFTELPVPDLVYKTAWDLEHLLGYVNTWSAVQHYIKAKDANPVDMLRESLQEVWTPGTSKSIIFPILLRAGRL